MAFDRSRARRGKTRLSVADTKEERSLFPVWTLIVIAGCIALWVFGAKIYQDRMAAYDTYAAISRIVSQDTYFPGVTVDGVDLGGMTREEAAQLFSGRQSQTASEFSLIVAAGEKRWKITSEQVPVTFNADTVLAQAYNVGRVGTLEERYARITQAQQEGAHYVTGFDYDRSAVDHLVEVIAGSLEYPAQDATLNAFDPNNHTFTFTKESSGYVIDRTALKNDILAALDERAYDRVIIPQGQRVEPEVTLAQLQGYFGKIASYTTTTTKDRDRNTNIAISAEAINGRMVLPGETMSFNNCTGQRTGAKGYREAGAIAGGVLVDDTGGGVCQTSSTLFNAVVRADLEIVERTAHSWPSTYVEKGEDATVNYPSLDFVFRNNGEFPIFVVAWYADREVTVEIYGKMLEDGMTIDLESTVTKTMKPSDEVIWVEDETLPVGQVKSGRQKRTGYVVDTYKVYKAADGSEIERKKLWTTTYRAQQEEMLFNDNKDEEP